MEDVLTEAPPPSRFLIEDLDNFASPSPRLPSPFLLSPNPSPSPNPSLLILLLSPSSLSLLPQIPNPTLSSSLFLPELPLSLPSSSSSSPSPINLFSLSDNPSVQIASVPCHVSPSRSKAVARLLLSQFPAADVLVFDSIKLENFRGRLAADEEEPMVFKMETREERRSKEDDKMVKGLERLGSGSLVDGLGAAVMGECEMRRRRAAAVVAAAEGRGVSRVFKRLIRGFGVDVGDGDEEGIIKTGSWMESDLYT